MIGSMKMKIIFLTICFLSIGCSYVMDSFEGAIMNRASFSIDAYYDESAGLLNISWTETVSGEEGFAGYEVYMILEPWNEFGTYEVIAARFNLQTSSSRFFQTIGSLGSSDTNSVRINVSPTYLNGEGEYYVRLGFIQIGKDENDNYRTVNRYNYINYSSLSKISGYQAVYIH